MEIQNNRDKKRNFVAHNDERGEMRRTLDESLFGHGLRELNI